MKVSAQQIDYTQTGYFSSIVSDYIAAAPALQPFYNHLATIEGVQKAIDERQKTTTNRTALVDILQQQYKDVSLTKTQQSNIEQLLQNNTFTICTAHQPNIFTGPLYFIYKILHAIKLSNELAQKLPQYNFVPVYYMGSEDADLDELGHLTINDQKLTWNTSQTGAVGRMLIDDDLIKLIEQIQGQLDVYENGVEIMSLVQQCYRKGTSIQQATFEFVNELFAQYGLLILLPDSSMVKSTFISVMEKELNEGFSYQAVQNTVAAFPSKYKVQAGGRELNLFYLKDNKRERIEKQITNGEIKFVVNNTNIVFTHQQIIDELHQHPERFSPNVILRPVLQETILPNIIFIGGGGELAYWLELKKVFQQVNVPYPILVLRNSFVVVSKEMQTLANKLKLDAPGLFKSFNDLFNDLVKKESNQLLDISNMKEAITQQYQQIQQIVADIDISLKSHTEALKTKAMNKLTVLEKKMLKAEKNKFETQKRQLQKLKNNLFPNESLQERVNNFLPFYAKWGSGFIDAVYQYSPSLEQQFTVLTEIH